MTVTNSPPPLPTVAAVAALRRAVLGWREAGKTVALVPTMGALHRGHMALVAEARRVADKVVTSIFVNPRQFGPSEDLARYPRPLAQDQTMLTAAGCDLLYAPDAAAMYPEGFATGVDAGPLGQRLEGAFRPGHFTGVATVVIKLLLQALPDIALFGEKDYQQLLVIRRAVTDLDLPVHVLGVPTVRDGDGLALSSRNAYLSATERATATLLPQALREAVTALQEGGAITDVLAQARTALAEAGFQVDYLELADAMTLMPVEVAAGARLLVAARLGRTRLIDTMAV